MGLATVRIANFIETVTFTKVQRKIEILRVIHQFSISFKLPRFHATSNMFLFLYLLFWQVPGSETSNFSLEFLCKELKELTRQLGAVIQCHGVGLAVYWRLLHFNVEKNWRIGLLMWNSHGSPCEGKAMFSQILDIEFSASSLCCIFGQRWRLTPPLNWITSLSIGD